MNIDEGYNYEKIFIKSERQKLWVKRFIIFKYKYLN